MSKRKNIRTEKKQSKMTYKVCSIIAYFCGATSVLIGLVSIVVGGFILFIPGVLLIMLGRAYGKKAKLQQGKPKQEEEHMKEVPFAPSPVVDVQEAPAGKEEPKKEEEERYEIKLPEFDFKMIGTWTLNVSSSKSAQNAISDMYSGYRYIDFDYDSEKEKYFVTDFIEDITIGYLPEDAEDAITNLRRPYISSIIVDSVNVKENGKCDISVSIFADCEPDYEISGIHIVGSKYCNDCGHVLNAKYNDVVLFLREAENQYDSDAVLCLNKAGYKLGYLPNGEEKSKERKAKNMVLEYINNSDIVYGLITKKMNGGMDIYMKVKFFRK